MATFEMPVWQMISIAVTILGAFVGVMKMLLVQMERRLDQRFAIVDKDSERLRQVEIGTMRCSLEGLSSQNPADELGDLRRRLVRHDGQRGVALLDRHCAAVGGDGFGVGLGCCLG